VVQRLGPREAPALVAAVDLGVAPPAAGGRAPRHEDDDALVDLGPLRVRRQEPVLEGADDGRDQKRRFLDVAGRVRVSRARGHGPRHVAELVGLELGLFPDHDGPPAHCPVFRVRHAAARDARGRESLRGLGDVPPRRFARGGVARAEVEEAGQGQDLTRWRFQAFFPRPRV